MQTIFTRRSIRRYTDQPVPRPLIEQVLTAAIWAASSHNRQPWRFAVLTDTATKARLAEAMGARLSHDLAADGVDGKVIASDVARSYARITGAPAAIMVCLTMRDMDTYPDQRRSMLEHHMAVQSAAMAGMNLLLAAHDAGLGACWMCAPLFCPDVARAVLELPVDWEPQGMITLGFPAENREKTRRPLEESVLWR